MPPRPKDADEFDALMARVAEDLMQAGQPSAAETITRARSAMRHAGYQGGRGAAQTRQAVLASLESLVAPPEADTFRDDILAAVRWVREAGQIDREVSAKGHLSRRPTRDILER